MLVFATLTFAAWVATAPPYSDALLLGGFHPPKPTAVETSNKFATHGHRPATMVNRFTGPIFSSKKRPKTIKGEAWRNKEF